MTKEQILELISKYVTSTAAEMIAAEFEKKEKEAVEFLEWVLDKGYAEIEPYTTSEIYELFKREKNV